MQQQASPVGRSDDNQQKVASVAAYRLSDEPTAVTPAKPTSQPASQPPSQPAAPGKKWVKVKKTETSIDAKGYMVT